MLLIRRVFICVPDVFSGDDPPSPTPWHCTTCCAACISASKVHGVPTSVEEAVDGEDAVIGAIVDLVVEEEDGPLVPFPSLAVGVVVGGTLGPLFPTGHSL